MSLYSKAWVRRVRKMGNLPSRGGVWVRFSTSPWRAIFPILFLILPILANEAELIMAFWGVFLMVGFCGSLQMELENKLCLTPLYFLPVSESLAFSHIERTLLTKTAWSFADAVVLLSHGISLPNPTFGIFRMLYGAAFYSAGIVGTCALVIALFPKIRVGWLWLFNIVAGMLVMLEGNILHQYTLLKQIGAVLVVATPPGWAAHVAFWNGKLWTLLASLAALLAVIFTFPATRKILRRRFVFWPLGTSDIFEPSGDGENGEEDFPASQRLSDTVDAVSGGDFLKTPWMNASGWIERLILRFLTPREKYLLPCIEPRVPGWTPAYRRAAYSLLALPFVMRLLQFWSQSASWWLFALTVLFALLSMTPFIGGLDTIMDIKTPLGNGLVSPIAMLPVGIREIRAAVRKISFLRRLLALPWFFWATGIATFTVQHSIFAAFRPALMFWLLSVALQPLWFVLHVSYTSKDGRFSLRAMLFILGFLIIGASTLVAIGCIVALAWIGGLVACTVVAAEAFAFESFYLRWYGRKGFDLIVTRR